MKTFLNTCSQTEPLLAVSVFLPAVPFMGLLGLVYFIVWFSLLIIFCVARRLKYVCEECGYECERRKLKSFHAGGGSYTGCPKCSAGMTEY